MVAATGEAGQIPHVRITDLGPMEQAILKAVVHAELLGSALSAARLWRGLPGYSTHLPNVEAALADGAPLRGWVARHGELFAAIDRSAVAHGMAAASRRADARWDLVRPVVRGVAKLPWIEAVGCVGHIGRGSLDDVQAPCLLVLIAEGGRTRLAARAIDAWRRGRRAQAELFEVVEVIDSDELVQPTPSSSVALAWTSLRPVSNPAGWQSFVDANPWLATSFPCWTLGAPEHPDRSVADRRLDGRFAAARRALVAGRADGALLGDAERRGRLRGLEDRFERRLGRRRVPGIASVVPAALADRFSVRWAELASWEVAGPAIPEPPRRAVAEPTPAVQEQTSPAPRSGADPEPPSAPIRPRTHRTRPARDAGERSAAAGTIGQRSRGAGRKGSLRGRD